MKTRNIFLTLVFMVVIYNFSYSQVAGISASKIGTYCSDVVPSKDLEFEPSFNIGSSSSYWNEKGKLSERFSGKDSSERISGMAIRCTYGLSDKVEVGILAPSDASFVSAGIKYNFFTRSSFALAIISGLNIPFEKKIYSDLDNDASSSIAAGLVFSNKFSENLLFDVDVQTQSSVYGKKKLDFFANSDIGYYLKENLQLICGFGYFRLGENSSSQLNFHPGVSYETGENFLIVVSSPIGIYGHNSDQTYGLNVAFTITIR